MKRYRIVLRIFIIVIVLAGCTVGLRYWMHYHSLEGRMERGHQVAEEMRTYYYEHQDIFDELPSKAEKFDHSWKTSVGDGPSRTMKSQWADGEDMYIAVCRGQRLSITQYQEKNRLFVEFLYLPDGLSGKLEREDYAYNYIPLENHWYICVAVRYAWA